MTPEQILVEMLTGFEDPKIPNISVLLKAVSQTRAYIEAGRTAIPQAKAPVVTLNGSTPKKRGRKPKVVQAEQPEPPEAA